jgi:hypothetical protein
MPKPRNLAQNKTIHALLRDAGIDKELKAQMVLDITKDRTDSTANMYYAEANEMIIKLGGRAYDSSMRTTQASRKNQNIPVLAKASQKELIEAYGKRFFTQENGLQIWIEKRIGHYPVRTSKEAQSCIEALKKMVARKAAN